MPSTRCSCGWNATSESRKSGTPKPSACHRRKSATDAARYAALVREPRRERLDRFHDRLDEGGCLVLVGLLWDRAVLHLQGLELRGRFLEAQPRGVGRHIGGERDLLGGDVVLENLGFADDGVDRDVRHVNLRSRVRAASAARLVMRPIGRCFKARCRLPAMCCGPARLSCVGARFRGGLRHAVHARATRGFSVRGRAIRSIRAATALSNPQEYSEDGEGVCTGPALRRGP